MDPGPHCGSQNQGSEHRNLSLRDADKFVVKFQVKVNTKGQSSNHVLGSEG